jgi:hypothetical protein
MIPLRRRMIEAVQIRNLAEHTQHVYVEHVARFARHWKGAVGKQCCRK